MQRKDIKVRSSTGDGEFDCYLVLPDGQFRHAVAVRWSAAFRPHAAELHIDRAGVQRDLPADVLLALLDQI